MTEDCEFCKIVRRESPASIICEGKTVLAFLDFKPFTEGHTLVITKKHYETIYEVPVKELTSLFSTVKKTAHAVKRALHADGISIQQNNGKAANQHIFHIHVHVIPRHESIEILKPEDALEVERVKLDAVAARIRGCF